MSELELFNYEFPPELIAQAPASPRDSAKLLVFDRKTGETHWDTFKNFEKYLPPRSVLVLNETKVIPARLEATKPTGGKVRLLWLAIAGGKVEVLADRELKAGETLAIQDKPCFRVISRNEKSYALKPLFPISHLYSFLEKHGRMPIPPYIKHTPLKEAKLKTEYQTVFAKKRGSVAAPTASLHFTKQLLAKLKKAGHDIKFVTLHVNLGTFASVTPEQLRKGKLHSEWYEIPTATAQFLEKAKAHKRPIVAVGTTVVRTLESASGARGRLKKLQGKTDLFIRPGYKFKFASALVTNFHVPKSSLLMLASAFASRERILRIYRQAIHRRFRLFSFGDGMLIK